jgi:hypothetical protein
LIVFAGIVNTYTATVRTVIRFAVNERWIIAMVDGWLVYGTVACKTAFPYPEFWICW